MSSTLCLNDEAFGPSVQGCRGDLDFTQKFERIFLSIIPACVFIALALTRVAVLSQKQRTVSGVFFQWIKLTFIVVYSVTQLSLLALLAAGAPGPVHSLAIAAAAVVFAASIFILPLSYLEHSRAYRPSTILSIYIILTLLFDIAQARTAWLTITTQRQSVLAQLFTSSIAFKVVILVLEAIPKTRWIRWGAKEKHSPEESSGVLSLGIYFWLNKLLLRGYKDILQIEDLYTLGPELHTDDLSAKFTKRMNIQRYLRDPNLGLVKDLCKILAGPMLKPIAPRVALIGFKFCQPLFINTVLLYLSEPKDTQKANIGYALIGACTFIYLGIAISTAFFDYYNQKAVYMVRGCLVSAIYKKTSQTKITDADDSAAVTLMSTDIERIVKGAPFTHDVWANVVEVAIGCWLLENNIGVAFLVPVVTIAVCGITLSLLLRLFAKKQKQWMEKIQIRVGLTSNAISHMKLYKISGITAPVADLIQSLRVEEIEAGNQFRWLLIAAAIIGLTPAAYAPVITFALTSKTLGVTTIFTSFSYIILVTGPLSMLFQRIPTILASLTSLQRIQRFLVTEPRVDYRQHVSVSENVTPSDSEKEGSRMENEGVKELAFSIKHGNFGWGGEKMTLCDINAIVPAKTLTLVIGPVASGKSTFCKVLLGEIPVFSGRVATFLPVKHIGYCEQTPFLYNATVRDNIIGHSAFDQKKYDEIIDATMLTADVRHLPQGHDTKVGSNGIMLSGGQKQRVSVARTLYAETDVMIFDDVLSGLDTDTENELFRRVFGTGGIINRRNATAVVCTHSVKHLPSAGHVIALGTDGTIVEEGTYEDLMKNNKYVQNLGITSDSVSETSARDDKTVLPALAAATTRIEADNVSVDDRSRQTGDWAVYRHYFNSVSPFSLLSLVVSGIVHGFSNNFATAWLKFWSEDTFHQSSQFYIGIFALLRTGVVLGLTANGFTTLISMITFSGNVLHHRALTTVITAPLRFFTTTDAGVVTNLFSQDMTLIDGELAPAFTNVSIEGFDLIAKAFVIAAATPYLAAAYPFIFGILYVIQSFYLRTSRQMRLLDLEAKSPLYTHFMDTIKGIATIRAFGWEEADIARNTRLLDTSQRPGYLLAMIKKWLMTILQLLVGILAVGVVSLATQLRTNSALTGASLVTLLAFSDTLSDVILYYTALETSIGAVNRLRSFSQNVKPEDQPGEDIEPPVEWPQGGRIDICGVSASYAEEQFNDDGLVVGEPKDLVLRDLNLTITPGQKVALCGRTGSGKSTLILLLLRLLDPLAHCSKNMEIDGIPFWRIDRATLRKRIIAIPQDAVFLPDGSTIKANIDPHGIATEAECLGALSTVQLAGFVEHCGLTSGMSADDLSAGQKQLFSLGRAILRKRVRERMIREGSGGGIGSGGGLLLLDEVSSNVDAVTDRAMQEVIRVEFAQFTIVMVSHRLDMVMDYFDRVVVLDHGRVVETGAPAELVESEGSRFGELWAMRNSSS